MLGVWFLVLGALNGQVYDDSQRSLICDQTLMECTTACYCQDKSLPLKSTCDPDTLNFECMCTSNYVPPTTNTTFQAYFASCNINRATCMNASGGDSLKAQACDRQYRCLPSVTNGKSCYFETITDANSTNPPALSFTSAKLSIYDSSSSIPTARLLISTALLALISAL
ncbi:hypothetical protein DSO57_1004647 [Entomophthora muscae]|uniref:Uncharacterized protein n=1 Tax=Entomophthora muscae TaxID=34485 RepID=A0ACC2SKX6_9FUNG|nr:hypothetical protein DSO57_1004647 [Entomophthora muscae]